MEELLDRIDEVKESQIQQVQSVKKVYPNETEYLSVSIPL